MSAEAVSQLTRAIAATGKVIAAISGVHGWDAAVATGYPAEFPEDIAEAELTFTRGKLGDVPPGRFPFAPRQPVNDAAPAIQRLVACLGRDVSGHESVARSAQ